MAKAKLLQPSMTAGEIAPSLYGRVDISRYPTGLRRCRNFIVRPSGGVENRPGLHFVADLGSPTNHRNLPFVFSTGLAYVLIFGDGFIRFYSGGQAVAPATTAYAGGTTYDLDAYVTDAGVTYRSLQAANVGNTPASSALWWVEDDGLQISAPWTLDELPELRYTQSADIMYLVCGTAKPRELRRTSSNVFELPLYISKEGPFLDLNVDEAVLVAATGVQGNVQVSASSDLFTADHVGTLLYIESKNLGVIRPWVVGDRSVTLGALRRSDGKTYQAVTVPGAGTWHETGPRQPVQDTGRAWDGAGDTKTNGVDTWSVGIEWEYVDSGYGVVELTAYNSPTSMDGVVQRRLPAQVVGSAGSPSNTWPLVGDGTTVSFAIAGAGYGIYAVTIDGVPVQSGSNHGGGDPYCVSVNALLPDGRAAGELRVGDSMLLFDPETYIESVGEVTYAQREMAQLFRVATTLGASLTCSAKAPIPVRSGGFQTPENLLGHDVLVRLDGRVAWATVVDVETLAVGPVMHITVGDRCFWAGDTADAFLLHHNAKPVDP